MPRSCGGSPRGTWYTRSPSSRGRGSEARRSAAWRSRRTSLDLALFALLMHLSDGPTSPFFVYFVFATLCGAIRWHGRGALVTGCVALTLYVMVTAAGARYFGTGTLDGLRFVTRCAHLATIAALLAYLGAHHRRLERELGSLARWPRRPSAGEEEGLRAILAHAAGTLGTRRVVLVWEEHDEPWLRVAQQDGSAFQLSREAPDAFGEIVAGLTGSFVCEDLSQQPPARALVRTEPGVSAFAGRSCCRRSSCSVSLHAACMPPASVTTASRGGSSRSTRPRCRSMTSCSVTSSGTSWQEHWSSRCASNSCGNVRPARSGCASPGTCMMVYSRH